MGYKEKYKQLNEDYPIIIRAIRENVELQYPEFTEDKIKRKTVNSLSVSEVLSTLEVILMQKESELSRLRNK